MSLSRSPGANAHPQLSGKKRQYPMRARAELDDVAIDFIEARDTFFLASVMPDGAPYVQHRGGEPGFLRAVDRRTLAFGDYAGNQQYVTVDNLESDPRVMLIVVDFARQRRVKVWGRARVVHEVTPELAPTIEASRGEDVERIIVVDVEAWTANCRKHITPRFTADEWQRLVNP